jgi:hypothetical protein
MTAPIGHRASCAACGKRGKRFQNIPDDPKVVAAFGLPQALACSSECMRKIMEGEVTLPKGGFGFGWIR